ncbi:MAG: membrane protein [Saprospiraceae bacterium]|nr:MAG: membrane protein [Saprospiraceae bacterium]
MLTSCNTAKYLEPDQQLLKGNDIKFIATEKINNKRTLRYELSTLYKQQENGKFFFIPREWFYLATQGPNDTTALDRFQKRVIAEVPSIYDEGKAQTTLEAMISYLQYKGYFLADGYFEDEIRKHKAYVTYFLDPKQNYTIDSVFFNSPDSNIHHIVNGISQSSNFKRGNSLDLGLYEKEKKRISSYLRNIGYANFYAEYFERLEVDTMVHAGKNMANIYINILPPYGDSSHQVFKIGRVDVFPDFDPVRPQEQLIDTLIEGYYFHNPSASARVKPMTIIREIFLHSGDLFEQDNLDKSNLQLSTLGIYRFVRIRQETDSLDASKLNFRIELTPNQKMELGLDFELNYTNRSSSSGTGNLIGVSLSPSLKNRNLFRGAELLATNISAGVEMDPSGNAISFWNTIDLGFQSALYFPRFLDYFGIWKGLNKVPFGKNKRLLRTDFYNTLKEKGATRISGSYNFLQVVKWYRYNLFNAAYGYDFQRSPTSRYIINHIGIDFLDPITEPNFDSLLTRNPFLQRSWGQQVFVSLLFRDLNYVYNSRINRFGESNYVGLSLELAGAEIWAANAIYNEFALKPTTFKLGNKIDFSQYAVFNADFRYYRQFGPSRSIATRFNIGFAVPFGLTSDVPYVKQLYVGGANSIRGWAPRGLGPGGYLDPLSLDPGQRELLYQTGNLKLEFNLEYRFNIFWLMKGALFLDGGNVWTTSRDLNRCGSQFLFSSRTSDDCITGDNVNDPFYKQIALATGFGLRFDFSYFIFRLDLGIKLRYPYPSSREGSVSEWDYWENFKGWGIRDINPEIGLGYPF